MEQVRSSDSLLRSAFLVAGLAVGILRGAVADAAAPRAVPGELVIRLRADFPVCAHCVLAESKQFAPWTGSGVLDRVVSRHHITELQPLFGGVYAAAGHAAALQRIGRATADPVILGGVNQTYLVHVDVTTDLRALAAQFRQEPSVVSAEPNYLYQITGEQTPVALPNDPFLQTSGSWGQPFPDLWGLFQIDAPAAWQMSEGKGAVVAVVDTGVDLTHPDLQANIWHNPGEVAGNGRDDDGNGYVDDVDGWDFTRCGARDSDGNCTQGKLPGPRVTDVVGHGTHVAGTIAAGGNNGIGIIGVAPLAHVMALEAFDASGMGTSSDIAEALFYAAENGADVINASWTGPASDVIAQAVSAATQLFGVVVVAAAGDDTAPLVRGYSPAILPHVLAVGATTHTDALASFSNFGGPLALVAPGGGDSEPASDPAPDRSILSLLASGSQWGTQCTDQEVCDTDPGIGEDANCHGVTTCAVPPWVLDGQYIRASGTSMAAPHVSGVAALVRSRHPEFTRAQVEQVLVQSADDLGPSGWDPTFGYGRINAARAVAIDTTPVAQLTSPGNGAKVWQEQFPLAISGTVGCPGTDFGSWKLTVRDATAPAGAAIEVAHGITPIDAGILGTLGLQTPGHSYVLALQATDAVGHLAQDTKTFLIPDPQFTSVPIPDRFNRGTQNQTLSADGTRITYESEDSTGWIYDTPRNSLHQLTVPLDSQYAAPDGSLLVDSPFMTPDGELILFKPGILPDPNQAQYLAIYRIADSSIMGTPIPTIGLISSSGTTVASDEHGGRFAFVSSANLDPIVGNPDGVYQVFLYDLPSREIQQITRALSAPSELELSADGRRLVFSSIGDLDPTATTGGHRQVFLYDCDNQITRQLSGRDGGTLSIDKPTISSDGSTVAYRGTDYNAGADPVQGLFVVNLADGTPRHVVDNTGFPNFPLLSADGKTLTFATAADLDPTVGNEDLNSEIFQMDLPSGAVRQLTDTVNNLNGPGLSAGDYPANTLLAEDDGWQNGPGTKLFLGLGRIVPRRLVNQPPVLTVPSTMTGDIGTTVRIPFSATDPDGDPIVFYAELTSFSLLANEPTSVFTDNGDGTGELDLSLSTGEAGTYVIPIAAFDGVGGVTIKNVTIVMQDQVCVGDCQGTGGVTAADLVTFVNIALGTVEPGACSNGLPTGGGTVTISTIIQAVNNAMSGCRKANSEP